MIKKAHIAALALLGCFSTMKLNAQTDEVGVKTAVNQLFEGMKNGDTALLRSAFSSQPVLQTVVKNKEGKIMVISEPLDSFIASVGRPHAEVYDERITFDMVKIDGDLAIVWAPYNFYIGNKFSHCGIDSFQLVRLNGEWKIQYLIDTRRRQGCKQ